MAQLANCQWIHNHQNPILTGATGRGKTWLSRALGNAACRHGLSVTYVRTPRLFEELCIAHGDGSCDKRLSTLTKTDLLILPIELMQNLVPNNTLLASRFLQLSAHTIKRLYQARAILILPNAFHRVFVQISLLSSGASNVVMSLTKQQDITNSVNTSRETVSRALQMLIKSGVLHKVGPNAVLTK